MHRRAGRAPVSRLSRVPDGRQGRPPRSPPSRPGRSGTPGGHRWPGRAVPRRSRADRRALAHAGRGRGTGGHRRRCRPDERGRPVGPAQDARGAAGRASPSCSAPTRRTGCMPTVRSRCARIRLGLVGARDIEAIVADHDLADPPLAARLGRLAGGRPGIALAYARAPDAVLIRAELSRVLLDLTDARPSARLAAVRAADPPRAGTVGGDVGRRDAGTGPVRPASVAAGRAAARRAGRPDDAAEEGPDRQEPPRPGDRAAASRRDPGRPVDGRGTRRDPGRSRRRPVGARHRDAGGARGGRVGPVAGCRRALSRACRPVRRAAGLERLARSWSWTPWRSAGRVARRPPEISGPWRRPPPTSDSTPG